VEYNELVTVPGSDWLELRHVRDHASERGHVIIARFNAALVSKAQAGIVARVLGYDLPAAPDEFLDEVARGDFSKWDVTE